MQFQQMNIDAMKRTLDLMVGPKGTEVIAMAYDAINDAMRFAYNEGVLAGYAHGVEESYALAQEDAERDIEERLDATFDNGFMCGKDAAEQESDNGYTAGVRDAGARHNQAFDEGYIAGVTDARARPAVADDNVLDIIGERGSLALNGESDIDEQDQDEA